jgi:hypothetical protein
MNQTKEIQRLFRLYKVETKIQFVDPRAYAQWLVDKGWELPIPPDPLDLLAKKAQDALREETRRDAKTGREYKVNLSFDPGTGQGSFLIDVDEAERPVVLKCLVQRREQTAGDAYQIELIQEHWNNLHPDQEPIKLPHDYTMDVEIKKNSDNSGLDPQL